MPKRYGEPTRYLTFKLNEFVAYLRGPISLVMEELVLEPEGLTFEELRGRTGIGPQHLITNRQMVKLQEKFGIDTQRLRRFEP